MTNFEKYRNEILEISKNGDRVAVDKCTKKVQSCSEWTCWNCVFYNDDAFCSVLLMLWLYEEYQESPVDWSKVAVDTKILVSDDGEEWYRAYFARYENGMVYCWENGATSWTTRITPHWNYAKLAEEDAE